MIDLHLAWSMDAMPTLSFPRLSPEELLVMTSESGPLPVPHQYWGKVILEEETDIHTYFPAELSDDNSCESIVSERVLFLQCFLDALLDMPGCKPEISPTGLNRGKAPSGKSIDRRRAARKREALKGSETGIEGLEIDSTLPTPQSAFQISVSLLPPVPRATCNYNPRSRSTAPSA